MYGRLPGSGDGGGGGGAEGGGVSRLFLSVDIQVARFRVHDTCCQVSVSSCRVSIITGSCERHIRYKLNGSMSMSMSMVLSHLQGRVRVVVQKGQLPRDRRVAAQDKVLVCRAWGVDQNAVKRRRFIVVVARRGGSSR